MVKCPCSSWSLRNGLHNSPEWRQTTHHATMVLNFLSVESSNSLSRANKQTKTSQQNSGRNSWQKHLYSEKIPRNPTVTNLTYSVLPRGTFKLVCCLRLFPGGEIQQQRAGDLFFCEEKKRSGPFPNRGGNNEFQETNFNKHCRKRDILLKL